MFLKLPNEIKLDLFSFILSISVRLPFTLGLADNIPNIMDRRELRRSIITGARNR
jgi:hypothetical protein